MYLLIEIPSDIYEEIVKHRKTTCNKVIDRAIKNGKPLVKETTWRLIKEDTK